MPVDHIRYDLLTQEALRDVIRTVLTDAAVKGLPGDHHFFITFDTRADGVRMSSRLKSTYPEEMTIVLQHQFWDLTVGDDDFEVGLAFNGIPERLHIPLKAVKAFFDPSVQFGLQFTIEPGDGGASTDTKTAGAVATAPTLPVGRKKPRQNSKQEPQQQPKLPLGGEAAPATDGESVPSGGASNPPHDPATPGAEVVSLDRFRKK